MSFFNIFHPFCKLEIRAGTRNPDNDKVSALKELPGVTVVKAEMGDKESMTAALQGVDYFYLIPPQISNRTAVTIGTLEFAKEANVKHILFQSIFMADHEELTFGKQYKPIEAMIKNMGIPYTIVRLFKRPISS